MELSIIESVAQMPPTSLVVLCITAAYVISMVFLILRRAGVIQIGNITIRKYQEGQTAMHSMDEENADADDFLKQKLRQMTNSLRSRIVAMFSEYPMCQMTRRALTSSLRFPLYESIGNNHFTKELMPERFDDYRQRMIDALYDEYTDLRISYNDLDCSSDEMPPWETVSDNIEQFLDTWLRDVANQVKACSGQKIETYEKYMKLYESNHDTYRFNIAKNCADKNRRYIDELDRRTAQLSKDIKQRED